MLCCELQIGSATATFSVSKGKAQRGDSTLTFTPYTPNARPIASTGFHESAVSVTTSPVLMAVVHSEFCACRGPARSTNAINIGIKTRIAIQYILGRRTDWRARKYVWCVDACASDSVEQLVRIGSACCHELDPAHCMREHPLRLIPSHTSVISKNFALL